MLNLGRFLGLGFILILLLMISIFTTNVRLTIFHWHCNWCALPLRMATFDFQLAHRAQVARVIFLRILTMWWVEFGLLLWNRRVQTLQHHFEFHMENVTQRMKAQHQSKLPASLPGQDEAVIAANAANALWTGQCARLAAHHWVESLGGHRAL